MQEDEMTPLTWQKSSDGVERASRDGFEYRLEQALSIASSVQWYVCVREPKGIEFNAPCANAEFGKRFCEFRADAISKAVEEAVLARDVQHNAQLEVADRAFNQATDRMKIAEDQLTQERALSERLADALKHAGDALDNAGHDLEASSCFATLAAFRASRKEEGTMRLTSSGRPSNLGDSC